VTTSAASASFVGYWLFSVQTPDRAVQDLASFERPMIPVLIMAVVAVTLLIAAHVFWINTEAAHSPPRAR
jgi:hypothetical protein